MDYPNEVVNVLAVRVFKNNPLASGSSQDDQGAAKSECRFVFGVISDITTSRTPIPVPGHEHHTTNSNTTKIRGSNFNPIDLSSSASLKQLVLLETFQSGLFYEENSKLLAQEISTILLTKFQFTEATTSGRTPITISVIVNRKRNETLEDEQGHFSSYDEEEEKTIMSMNSSLSDDDSEDEAEGYIECAAFEAKALDKDTNTNEMVMVMEERCSICLDGFFTNSGIKMAKTHCGHLFHRDCVDKWLQKYTTCPMCRSTCISIV